MDKPDARILLSEMWVIVFGASRGQLRASDIKRLRTLCERLNRGGGVPGEEKFNSRVAPLCSTVLASGILDETNENRVPDLLLKIASLRELLE